MKLTYNVRNLPQRFNESSALVATIYNLSVVSSLVIILWLATGSRLSPYDKRIVVAVGTFLGALLTLFLM